VNWTQADDYALRTLVDLAVYPGARIREIAARTAIPGAHLAKVIQTLARAGLVETTRGRGGGVRLARDPGAISLLEVVEAIQGPLCFLRCPRQGEGCPIHTDCAIYRLCVELDDTVSARLQRVRIADLLHTCGERVPETL
jgi:Rrf2 family transcriptional regulator, nitric oxide-sensitive transcriptional repressor